MKQFELKMADMKVPKVDMSFLDESFEKLDREMEESRREENELKEIEKQLEMKHRGNVEKLLSEIVDNTSSINLMVEILQSNNVIQTEVLSLMQEILTIGTATNKEEAESKYKKVMKQITEKVGDVETAEKLLTMSKAVYHAGLAYYKIKNGG